MTEPKHKTSITRADYLQALGLFALAKQRYRECIAFEQQLARLLGFGDRDQFGGMYDALYTDGATLDDALKAEGIAVLPEDIATEAELRRALRVANHALKGHAAEDLAIKQLTEEVDQLLAKPSAPSPPAEAADA